MLKFTPIALKPYAREIQISGIHIIIKSVGKVVNKKGKQTLEYADHAPNNQNDRAVYQTTS